MRVLRFLFSSAVIIAIVAAVAAVVGREIYLVYAVSEFRQSVNSLRRIAGQPGVYFQECKKRGGNADVIESIQIRFTSDVDYVVEVICGQFQLDPIQVTKGTLAPFVKKMPGQSGIVWGDDRSGIVLNVFGRKRAIVVEKTNVSYESYDGSDLGLGPISSCQGFGYSCCAEENSLGNGQMMTGVSDCPKTCYSSCLARPVVLSLSTQPFYDLATRTVTINTGETVEFVYVLDVKAKTGAVAALDFGDGETTQGGVPSGDVAHVYTCAQAECVYTARISVTDGNGITSADANTSQIKVVVKGQ